MEHPRLIRKNTQRLKGYGRLSDAKCRVYHLTHAREILEILSLGKALPYSGGQSFGDATLDDACNLVPTIRITMDGKRELERQRIRGATLAQREV